MQGRDGAAESQRRGGWRGKLAPEGDLASFRGAAHTRTSSKSSGKEPQPAHSPALALATLSESGLRQNRFWKTFIAFCLQVEALTTERGVFHSLS